VRQKTLRLYSVLLCSLCLGIEVVYAHITPPVVLLSERDAVLGMMGNAARFFGHFSLAIPIMQRFPTWMAPVQGNFAPESAHHIRDG